MNCPTSSMLLVKPSAHHSNALQLPLICSTDSPPMPCRNEPHVHIHKEESNPLKWHGAELSVTILGNWQYYRAKVLRYMRQIAVITPYAQFRFLYKAEDDKNSLDVTFVRRTDKMPPPPKAGSAFHPNKLPVHLQLNKRLLIVILLQYYQALAMLALRNQQPASLAGQAFQLSNRL